MNHQFLPLLMGAMAAAHPLGNFSVSHYTRLHVSASGVAVTYVLDLAEVPAYELLKEWKLNPKSPQAELDEKAAEQAREWMRNLEFISAGQRLPAKMGRASVKISGGSGGLFTARVESVLYVERAATELLFEDKNFPERPGWKEIVIDGDSIAPASQRETDRSKALTEYPAGAMTTAPQDLRARITWGSGAKSIAAIPQPAPVPFEAGTSEAQGAASGETQPQAPRDFLSRVLAGRELGFGLMLACLAVAFGLGAMHAMSPGHGKTIVAAYLVGSRGTMRHAAFLGGMVTFTHTISVFALGLATLFLSKYFVPEKMIRVLEAISGVSIVAIGAWLLYKRLGRLRHEHHHHHDHEHHHAHDHRHDHEHDHHHHEHHDHAHSHSHVPEGDITLGSLIALGASGGLVPCPSAMVLLLFSISVGRTGLGLVLLVAFSLGLAGVLTAIGMLVLYAKHWLPDPAKTSRHPAFRFIPVLSAAAIVCIGLVMTGVSLSRNQ